MKLAKSVEPKLKASEMRSWRGECHLMAIVYRLEYFICETHLANLASSSVYLC
jgi:hypothetical protein